MERLCRRQAAAKGVGYAYFVIELGETKAIFSSTIELDQKAGTPIADVELE
jgi:hypothetical protein